MSIDLHEETRRAQSLRIATLMILALLSVVALSSSPSLPGDSPRENPPLILGVGEQRLVRFPRLLRYSLGSSSVRARPAPYSKDQLLLKGVSPGFTDLWVWKKDDETGSRPEHRVIRVEKIQTLEIRPELIRGLNQLNEAEVLYSGTGVILRGEVKTALELRKINALVSTFPKEVIDETETSEGLFKQSHSKLESWIRSLSPGKKLKIIQIDKELWIRGSVATPSERTAIETSALRLYPKIHFEIESLPDRAPTVHFKVFLLELKKTHFRSLGLSWPGGQEGAFRVTASGIQTLLQLDLTLQHMENEGSARILSKPELVVRAPGEAELFSGGELPVHHRTSRQSNVQWKPYGLILKLHVTHTTEEKVRLDILTEVSHLDPQVVSESRVPGLQTNRMKTQVDAVYGTPLFLSGLLQQGMREQARGMPILRDIPILGSLFGSEEYLKEDSELVAILLPSLTPPPAPMDRVERHSPRGPVPIPRNWLSPDEERQIQRHPNYPWSAFDEKP